MMQHTLRESHKLGESSNLGELGALSVESSPPVAAVGQLDQLDSGPCSGADSLPMPCLLLLLPWHCVLLSCSTCAPLPLTTCWLLTASTMSTWCDTCTGSCWQLLMSAPQVSEGAVQADTSGAQIQHLHSMVWICQVLEIVPTCKGGSDRESHFLLQGYQASDRHFRRMQPAQQVTACALECVWRVALK